MSEFKVSLEYIRSVEPHPNADRLELAKVESMDFRFVVQKGIYKVGDQVLYFPVDSLLLDKLAKHLGLDGKLGSKNRIKTIKLRGEISQGVVMSMPLLHSYFNDIGWLPGTSTNNPNDIDKSLNFTQLLNITKYEAPDEFTKLGNSHTRSLPADQRVYDIESVQRNPEETALLTSEEYVITEKLEGSHFSYVRDSSGDHVCSRRMEIKPATDDSTPSTWIAMARKYDLKNVLDRIETELAEVDEELLPYTSIALHAEMIGPGIQGNIYGLKEHELFFFDIILDGVRALDWFDFKWYTGNQYDNPRVSKLPIVPELAEYIPEDEPIDFVAYSNGQSQLAPVLREGIVIRRFAKEEFDSHGNRLILKVRSPEYLAKSEL